MIALLNKYFLLIAINKAVEFNISEVMQPEKRQKNLHCIALGAK